jgi:undecaprenyl diphosphate synthase
MSNTLTHIAIIPDGNRRWAKEKGFPTIEGHRRGFERAKELTRKSQALGIKILTLWAFSTENWKRKKDEVGYLMKIYERWIDSYLEEAIETKVRLIHIGRKDRINNTLLKKIQNAEGKTINFTKHTLVLALDYGGQDEIIRGIKNMLSSGVDPDAINESTFLFHLDTHEIPPPDLIIRTSGERRLSGFLLWSSAYSEYTFIDKNFPDFSDEDFENCITEFESRQRRFGK